VTECLLLVRHKLVSVDVEVKQQKSLSLSITVGAKQLQSTRNI
jgi:hypothetical protein